MSLSDLLERLGRGVFEAPFQNIGQIRDAPEIAEIRLAIFDGLKRKMQRAGGREIFPYNLVSVGVRGVGDAETAVLEGEFFRTYFEQEVRQQLRKMNCRFPEDLSVEVHVRNQLAEGAQSWIQVEMLSETKAAPAEPKERAPARLVVVSGEPSQRDLPLTKPRINIGRVLDVYREQSLTRRNDLAFSEDTPINRTVSREHAHIVYDKLSGEYRLYNDRWYQRGNKAENCGIWIVRDGMGQEVHRGARGTKLEDGDEIHFGKAVCEFRLG